MAQQVSGSEKTLLEAIRDGDIERPPLMRWNAWQQWRTQIGRKPRMSVDGFDMSNAQESALWKSTMLELFGPDWAVLAVSAEVPRDQPDESPPQLGVPGSPPAADAEHES